MAKAAKVAAMCVGLKCFLFMSSPEVGSVDETPSGRQVREHRRIEANSGSSQSRRLELAMLKLDVLFAFPCRQRSPKERDGCFAIAMRRCRDVHLRGRLGIQP